MSVSKTLLTFKFSITERDQTTSNQRPPINKLISEFYKTWGSIPSSFRYLLHNPREGTEYQQIWRQSPDTRQSILRENYTSVANNTETRRIQQLQQSIIDYEGGYTEIRPMTLPTRNLEESSETSAQPNFSYSELFLLREQQAEGGDGRDGETPYIQLNPTADSRDSAESSSYRRNSIRPEISDIILNLSQTPPSPPIESIIDTTINFVVSLRRESIIRDNIPVSVSGDYLEVPPTPDSGTSGDYLDVPPTSDSGARRESTTSPSTDSTAFNVTIPSTPTSGEVSRFSYLSAPSVFFPRHIQEPRGALDTNIHSPVLPTSSSLQVGLIIPETESEQTNTPASITLGFLDTSQEEEETFLLPTRVRLNTQSSSGNRNV